MNSLFFKTALRNLLKRKGSALLNVLGLVIGITCCLLIFQYVSYERSYDTFQTASSSIYRLRLDQYKQGKLEWKSATVYPAIGPAMKRDYPEVEDMCRLYNWSAVFANPENNIKFFETKGYTADPSALSMLGVKLLRGNPATALREPYQLIISQTLAKKYFGKEDVLGRTLEMRTGNGLGNHMYSISGVFKDYPDNAHLVIQFLTPYATLESYMKTSGDTSDAVNTSFGWYDYYIYLQFKPGTDPARFETKLPAFCDRYINSQEWNKANKVKCELHLIALRDIHLYSNYNEEAETNGNGQAVGFLFLIGFFILGIAWINYINLSTARSVERAREVGVRKVMGALRSDLVRQFMLESILLNLAALVLSLGLAYALSPSFNILMGRQAGLTFHMIGSYWLLFSALLGAGALLSGLYPAFVLSGYKPISVLKGAFKNTSGGLLLRKGLIVFQFAISVVLIAGTIIVYQQVSFMRHQQLGADISRTLVLTGSQSVSDSTYQGIYEPFKNELLKLPGVKSMTASSTVMGQEIYWTRGVRQLQPSQSSTAVTMYLMGVDYDFIPQFGIHMLAGRNFSKDFPVDAHRHSAILNEQGVRTLGIASVEDAIGKKIDGGSRDTLTIVGVTSNVHHLGLRRPIDPQLILYQPNVRDDYSIRLQSANFSSQLTAIQKVWNKYFPGDPFSYFFLDDFYGRQYKSDQQFGNTFTLFSFLAILIACFGLMGLSAYNILQRTKEIGIRKVLGASTRHVVFILSKDFLRLVILAFLIAIPAAWWIMHSWLRDYAYRININASVFLVAGIISTALALATISFHAIKAALANPVESLRTE
jgi:putative ABC transport system permease protein